MILFGVLLLLCASVWYVVAQRKPKNFPPGPWGFPVLGHLPLLGLEPHVRAMQWKSTYGPIVGIDFASFPCVLISDFRLAKEALASESFSGRPALRFSLDRSGGPAHGYTEGINLNTGRGWAEQRTFTHRALRQLGGFGTRSMEAIILQELHEFTLRLEPHAEARTPLDTAALFNVAIVNMIWTAIAGQRFDQDDPEVKRVARLFVESIQEASIFSMLSMFIPWLGDYFPDWLTGRADLEKQYKPVLEFLAPYVEEHWRTHSPGAPRDFIDAYIDKVKTTTDPESSFHESRVKHALPTTLMDLFVAGSETTSTTLRWVCLLLARYPVVQDSLATEIKAVLAMGEGTSSSRLPSLADRPSLPYTEAFLHEVMRFRPILPFGVFHNTTEAVHFNGFDIPKDTMVFLNTHEAHFNRELWGDPEVFRPERWLSASGGRAKAEFVRREGFLAFSAGKRVCLGEQLARDELFLFTVGLLQKFRIDVDQSGPPPTLDPKPGGTTQGPKSHKLVFSIRD